VHPPIILIFATGPKCSGQVITSGQRLFIPFSASSLTSPLKATFYFKPDRAATHFFPSNCRAITNF